MNSLAAWRSATSDVCSQYRSKRSSLLTSRCVPWRSTCGCMGDLYTRSAVGKRSLLDAQMRIVHANKYYFLKGGAERYVFELSALQQMHGDVTLPFAMQDKRNM